MSGMRWWKLAGWRVFHSLFVCFVVFEELGCRRKHKFGVGIREEVDESFSASLFFFCHVIDIFITISGKVYEIPDLFCWFWGIREEAWTWMDGAEANISNRFGTQFYVLFAWMLVFVLHLLGGWPRGWHEFDRHIYDYVMGRLFSKI